MGILANLIQNISFAYFKKYGRKCFNKKPEDFGIVRYTWKGLALDVDQDVNLNGLHLLEFPFKFGTIKGDFSCSQNNLTSLVNGPSKVHGRFDCSYNKLTSLVNGPKTVKGNYRCASNKLTSLKGAPRIIRWKFDCSDNKLTSLKFSPKSITRTFDFNFNPVKTFEGGPTFVGALICDRTSLESLKGAPFSIKGKIVVPKHLKHEIEKYIHVPQSIQFIQGLLS